MNGSSLAYFSLFVGIQVEWSEQIDIQSSDLAEVSPVGGITEAAWQRGGTWDCQETTSPSGQCYT